MNMRICLGFPFVLKCIVIFLSVFPFWTSVLLSADGQEHPVHADPVEPGPLPWSRAGHILAAGTCYTAGTHTHTQTCHKCLHLVCGYFFSAIHHQQHSLSVRPLLQIVVPHFHLPSNFSCCSTWSGFWGWSQGWAEPLSLAEPQRDPAQWVCPHFLTLGTSGFWSCSGWLNFLLQLLPFNQVLTTAVMTDLPVISNILSRLFESSQSVNTNNRLKANWAKTYYLSSHLFTLLSMITLT